MFKIISLIIHVKFLLFLSKKDLQNNFIILIATHSYTIVVYQIQHKSDDLEKKLNLQKIIS